MDTRLKVGHAADLERILKHGRLQSKVLELIATAQPLRDILGKICLVVEQIRTTGLCSILLMGEDGKLHPGAGPSLPPAALHDLDGLLIGPAAGSCGTAAYCGELVVVSDTETDPRWSAPAFQAFAASYGVKACWSHPFFAKDRRVLGTFAVSHTAKGSPSPYDVKLMETAAHLAGIAVERQKEQESLQKAYAGLERTVEQRTKALAQANENLLREIAQRERAEADLRQAQKMEAIGRLAAGVAHEINNPLGVILGFAQSMAREKRRSKALGFELPLASIAREAQRCKALVEELLTFSRTSSKALEPVNLDAVLRSFKRLMEPRARMQDVRIVLELGSGAPPLSADKNLLQQVLVNLANNALDAMPRGGTLTLRSQYSGEKEICVQVTDTGSGIPEEIRSKIFDPFFTTKPVGKGTGLGLSLVYEIVQQHGGRIEAQSQVGKGTTMTLRLPAGSVSAGRPKTRDGDRESAFGRTHGQHRRKLSRRPSS